MSGEKEVSSVADISVSIDKLVRVGLFALFAVLALAVGFLAALAMDRSVVPAPVPAPLIAPYAPSKCDGECRRAPSFNPFDVICPYCSRRFRVNPAPGQSTGAKPPIGASKQSEKSVSWRSYVHGRYLNTNQRKLCALVQ
jgi:hypothetical protein